MFTLTFLVASWLSLLGFLAGQPGLAAFGAGLGLLLIVGRLARSRRRRTRHAGASRPPAQQPPQFARRLDPDVICGAIRLCHPDLHPPERAELATTVISRLLEFERAERRGDAWSQ